MSTTAYRVPVLCTETRNHTWHPVPREVFGDPTALFTVVLWCRVCACSCMFTRKVTLRSDGLAELEYGVEPTGTEDSPTSLAMAADIINTAAAMQHR